MSCYGQGRQLPPNRPPHLRRPWSHHPAHAAWEPGQVRDAAAGGASRRSAKIADAPMDQSREAHHSVRPLHRATHPVRVGNDERSPASSSRSPSVRQHLPLLELGVGSAGPVGLLAIRAALAVAGAAVAALDAADDRPGAGGRPLVRLLLFSSTTTSAPKVAYSSSRRIQPASSSPERFPGGGAGHG
jgi:hypothetical protein